MANLINFLSDEITYSTINREERNLAAILYHLLLVKNNLQLFLKEIECEFPVKENEMGIYFEYAIVRDLWNKINCIEKKKKVIYDHMPERILHKLNDTNSVEEFNSYFLSKKNVSKKTIQNPGRWNVSKLKENFRDDDELKKVMFFKWAFNIKPDIVIHTSLKEAICIECKLESRIATYSVEDRNIKVLQTELQKYLMKELLGIKADHVLVLKEDKKDDKNSFKKITWQEIFSNERLEVNNAFVEKWIKMYEQQL